MPPTQIVSTSHFAHLTRVLLALSSTSRKVRAVWALNVPQWSRSQVKRRGWETERCSQFQSCVRSPPHMRVSSFRDAKFSTDTILLPICGYFRCHFLIFLQAFESGIFRCKQECWFSNGKSLVARCVFATRYDPRFPLLKAPIFAVSRRE